MRQVTFLAHKHLVETNCAAPNTICWLFYGPVNAAAISIPEWFSTKRKRGIGDKAITLGIETKVVSTHLREIRRTGMS